jgi:hypothetical protein
MGIFLKNIKIYSFTYWMCTALGAILLLMQFVSIGSNFPIPWEDEAAFILQALSWSERNTLFTESLSSDRIIMWMQPGYMILVGSLFKILGFSFDIARQISWFFFILAFIIFSIAARKINNNISLLILFLIFIIPSSTAIGNVARMEAAEIFIFAVTLYLLVNKYYWIALSVVMIGTLVHFNISYLALPVISTICLAIYRDKNIKSITPRLIDQLAILTALILVTIYILFILNNADSFIKDMQYQFNRKIDREILLYRSPKNLLLLFLGISLYAVTIILKKNSLSVFSILGLTSFLIYIFGQEMWYVIFLNLSIGLQFIVLIKLLDTKKLLKILIMTLMIFFYLTQLNKDFAEMRLTYSKKSYIDHHTISMIENELLKYAEIFRSNNQELKVSFIPSGVSLIFYNFLIKNNIKIIHTLPNEIQKSRHADLCINITRPTDPAWLSAFQEKPTPKRCELGVIISEFDNDIRIKSFR